MSRIHEALKKAEQDRTANVADSAVLSAGPPPTDHAPTNDANHTSAHSSSRVETINPRRGEVLGFEDVRANCVCARWRNDSRSRLFVDPALDPHGAEQFRTLRTRLYQLRGTQAIRTILVTSSIPAEGKTFVTSSLGHAFVRQADCRVLMIDADLRKSSLHKALGAPSGPGLTDYLSGTADEMAIIHKGQEDNLYFIPGGSEVRNPSELLLNGRLKTLMDRIAPAFDWVILDSPPCLPVADANVLADVCDGVLLVVRAESTPTETALRACQELQAKRVLGVVFNAAQEGSSYGSYYYDPGEKREHDQAAIIQRPLAPLDASDSNESQLISTKE